MSKANWTYKKLKDISTTICDGDWIESKDQSPEGIRLIQTGNIGNGIFKDKEDKSRFISEETFERLKCTEIFPGDILVSRLPDPIGRSCILPNLAGRMITAVDCSIVRLSDECLPKYYVHYTQSNRYSTDIINFTTGSTRKRISRKNLESLLIPVPSKETQLSIVKELDSLNESITMLQKQVSDLDDLAQSLFYTTFGDPITNPKSWPVKKLGEVCAVKSEIKRASKSFEKNEIIKYIDISSIDNTTNQLIGTTDFLFGEAPSRAQQKVEKGDVLISLVRPNLRNIAVVNIDGNNLVASSGFCILRGKNTSYHFIKSLVLTPHFTEYLVKRVTGANYPAVREEDIKDCKVGIPPLSIQQTFSSQIESIEESKATLNAQIKELQNLLAARMQYWFD